jgi:hypothetical protein
MKDYYQRNGQFGHFENMIAGGVSGLISWFSTYPFDTVKTVIQTTPLRHKPLSQFELLRINGMSSFRGITVCCLLGFSANAFAFLGEETAHKYLDQYLI